MSAFKDRIKKDIERIFLNVDEFSDLHTFNGREMPAQVDSTENLVRETRFSDHIDGMFRSDVLVYVSAERYGVLPPRGSKVVMDGKTYLVDDAIDEGGVYVLRMSANRGRGR